MISPLQDIKLLAASKETILGYPVRYFIWFIVLITLFRALFIPTMGLMPQDAYYYFYSEHLDWSYYDHPPMIAYFLKLFSILGKKVWVVKLTSFTLATSILISFFYLARRWLNLNQSVLVTALFSSTVMMSILSVLSGPDLPLLLFWIWGVYFAQRSVSQDRPLFWILTGLFMGMSFDGKYTGALMPGCLFLYLLFFKRKLLLTVWPYMGVLVMLIAMSPVIYWNYLNDFASIAYQSADRAQVVAEDRWKPSHFFASILQQSIVVGPLIYFLLLWKLPKQIFSSMKDFFSIEKNALAFFFYAIPFFLFVAVSVVYWVKLNWFMPAYIGGLLLLPLVLKKSMIKWQLIYSIVVHLALAVQVWLYPVTIRSDDTWFGWGQLAQQLDQYTKEYPDAFLVAGDHYKTTAELLFYMDRKVYGQNVFGKKAVHFDYIGDVMTDLNGKDALYIDSDTRFVDEEKGRIAPDHVLHSFERVEELEPIMVYSHGKPVRKFNVYYCSQYRWRKYVPKAR